MMEGQQGYEKYLRPPTTKKREKNEQYMGTSYSKFGTLYKSTSYLLSYLTFTVCISITRKSSFQISVYF